MVLRPPHALSGDEQPPAVVQQAEGLRAGRRVEVTTQDRGPAPLSGTAFRASRLSTPTADAGIGYYELGVAREANVLVVLQLNAMGNPAGEGPEDWVWTAETLQTALDRAID